MRQRRRLFSATLVAICLAFGAAVVPLPWYVLEPGPAVDLSSAMRVGGLPAPRDRFFLTDVRIMRASPLRLALVLFPGVTLARAEAVVPRGVSSTAFEDVMQQAMAQSQSIAAVVAERAAGLAVPFPAATVHVTAIDAGSATRGLVAVGDIIERIDRQPVAADSDVRNVVSRLRPGAAVQLTLARGGQRRTVIVRTVALDGATRLGVLLTQRYGPARLAIPVRYALGDVGGSSGGLMMALRIYDSLHAVPMRAARTFAGTGTLGPDGRVGPIEGTRQKLIAAKRAGASVFFVPRANFAEIAGERDLRVVPVDTFGQALRALDG